MNYVDPEAVGKLSPHLANQSKDRRSQIRAVAFFAVMVCLGFGGISSIPMAREGYSASIDATHQKKKTLLTVPSSTLKEHTEADVLVSARACNDCQDILASLEAFGNCTSRALGLEHRFFGGAIGESFWPYPHYIKMYALEQAMKDLPDSRWFMWLDDDVRIIELDYPLQQMLDYAEQVNTSLITIRSNDYGSCNNNLFMVRNDEWGRRFLETWKYLMLNNKSCGNFDLCHFGVAALSIVMDFIRRVGDEKLQPPSNKTLAPSLLRLASTQDSMQAYQIQSFANFACGGPCESDDQEVRKVGPLLMVPVWENVTMLPYPLIVEPTSGFDAILRENRTLFAIHAKYHRSFCPHRADRQNADAIRIGEIFRARYVPQMNEKCTAEEVKAISYPGWSKHNCWARYDLLEPPP
jgi:hypothetical protein